MNILNLPTELHQEIFKRCTPLTLFFLQDTCTVFKNLLTEDYEAVVLNEARTENCWFETRVRAVLNCDVDTYIRPSKECPINWDEPSTFSRLPLTTQYAIIYDLLEHVSVDDLHDHDDDVYKQVMLYWVYTGSTFGEITKKHTAEWQVYRDVVLGKGELPKYPSILFENSFCFHCDASVLLKYGEFDYNHRDQIYTEVAFQRKVFTQDEFFSVVKTESDTEWEKLFAEKGMEASWLRYGKGHAEYFLRSNNLRAFFRHCNSKFTDYKLQHFNVDVKSELGQFLLDK